jgi:drug/metabolite transporter (DMT)-like permease
MKPTHLILLIVLNFCWAASYSTFKVLAPYLENGSIVTLRFTVAALVLLVLWPVLPGKAPRGLDLMKASAMGIIVFVFAPRLQVAGVQLGQAGDSSVLIALEPLITSVAAALFLREHIALRRWLGFSFGILGVLLLARVWRPDFKWLGLTANLLFISSFVCETAYSIMGKPLIERAGFMKVLSVALLAGAAVNLLLNGHSTFLAVPAMPLTAWGIIGFLALICTLVGYSVWFVVIRDIEVNVAVLTLFIQPVVGVAVAGLWLGEPLHWGQLWGSVAIVAGLVVGLSGRTNANSRTGNHNLGNQGSNSE